MEEQMNQNQPEMNTEQSKPEEVKPQANPEGQNFQQAGSNSKDVEENKLWAFLGYLGVLCLIPLLAKKDSPFAQFHAKQGLILTIASFFSWIPIFGWILGIGIFVLWIMGVINVFSGKMKPLPIAGELAKKINI